MKTNSPRKPKPVRNDGRTSPLVVVAALVTGLLAMGAGKCQFSPVINTTPFELAIAESDLKEAEAETRAAQQAYDARKQHDKDLKNAQKELKTWTILQAAGSGNQGALAQSMAEVARLTAVGYTYPDKATLKARLREARSKEAAARRHLDRCRTAFDEQGAARDAAQQAGRTGTQNVTRQRTPTGVMPSGGHTHTP